MTRRPAFGGVAEETRDLLDLLNEASEERPSVDRDWDDYVMLLRQVADGHAGRIDPNLLRPLTRASTIPPRSISSFARKARTDRLVEDSGEFVISDDVEGGNAGKPVRILRWIGA